MAIVTEPILTDATGQDIVDKLDELVGAVRPTASDIPLTPPSGMTSTNVQDGFSEIKQSLSVIETTPSFNTQAITDSASDPSFIQKSGNTVTVFLNFSASATVTAWSTLICTLPSGYRPSKTIFPLGKIGNNIATLRVGSDGGILSSVGMSSGNSANISFTFMTS